MLLAATILVVAATDTSSGPQAPSLQGSEPSKREPILASRVVNLYARDAEFDPRKQWVLYDVPETAWFRVTDIEVDATWLDGGAKIPTVMPLELLSREKRNVHVMHSRWTETSQLRGALDSFNSTPKVVPWHSQTGFAFPPGSQVCLQVPFPTRNKHGRISYTVTGYLSH